MRSSPAYVAWRRVAGPPRRFGFGARGAVEVYEIESEQPGGLLRRLVLSEPSRVRRIESYPSDWRNLELPEILALFETA